MSGPRRGTPARHNPRPRPEVIPLTTNAFSPAPTYTISGTGPYDVPFDYGAGVLAMGHGALAGNATLHALAVDALSPQTEPA